MVSSRDGPSCSAVFLDAWSLSAWAAWRHIGAAIIAKESTARAGIRDRAYSCISCKAGKSHVNNWRGQQRGRFCPLALSSSALLPALPSCLFRRDRRGFRHGLDFGGAVLEFGNLPERVERRI